MYIVFVFIRIVSYCAVLYRSIIMSREKGRTRQGKKKVSFYCNKKTPGSAVKSKFIRTGAETPKKYQRSMVRAQARQIKFTNQEQAGVIIKPTPVKPNTSIIMSREKGRTRQGKKKVSFYCNKKTPGSAVKSKFIRTGAETPKK